MDTRYWTEHARDGTTVTRHHAQLEIGRDGTTVATRSTLCGRTAGALSWHRGDRCELPWRPCRPCQEEATR